jgi:hypothetical protein
MPDGADVFAVADRLVALVKREAPDQVALIAWYGSYATGSPRPDSDLDLYYIPDDAAATRGLYRSIVFQGRPFEFWGVSWEFAERIASGRHRWSVAPSIIANAQLLYVRSPADEARFDGLKAQIAQMQTPDKRQEALARAADALDAVAAPLLQMMQAIDRGDSTEMRAAGSLVIDAALDCLCLVNQRFLTRHWSSDLAAVAGLANAPDALAGRIHTIMSAPAPDTALYAARSLVDDTRQCLLDAVATGQPQPADEVMEGYYAAVVEYVSKIRHSLAHDNWAGAAFVAAQMQTEMVDMLAQVMGGPLASRAASYDYLRTIVDARDFPDVLAAIIAQDATAAQAAASAYLAATAAWFTAQGLSLHSADDLAGLDELIG